MSPLGVAHWKFEAESEMPQKWVIAANGDPTNEPPWGSTLKIETGAENIMPANDFSWPPARGVGKIYIYWKYMYICIYTLCICLEMYSEPSQAHQTELNWVSLSSHINPILRMMDSCCLSLLLLEFCDLHYSAIGYGGPASTWRIWKSGLLRICNRPW